MWDVEVIYLHCCIDLLLVVITMFIEVRPIRMSNLKTKFIVQIEPFQNTIPPHKPCLKYSITIGPNFLCLPRFNPCEKYPHLTISFVSPLKSNWLFSNESIIWPKNPSIFQPCKWLPFHNLPAEPIFLSRSLGLFYMYVLRKKPDSFIL